MTRSPSSNAELALLLEVAATPTPGNVDRCTDHPTLRFEHFLAGAVGARPGLERAERTGVIGAAFRDAIAGMADQRGGNTQFGALLLVIPLLVAAKRAAMHTTGLTAITQSTTVTDAIAFYRAFEYVDVLVGDPPRDAPDLDVRRGEQAAPALRSTGTTLADVMAMAASHDDVAREWTSGFERSFHAADLIDRATGSALERGAYAHLRLLSDRPDTLIATKYGEDVAISVQQRAQSTVQTNGDPQQLAEWLVEQEYNPGATADILVAGYLIALERGLQV